jgi:nuclear GTP-binding protein
LAFHASITNSFGKGSLIALLRQFAILHVDRKQVSVGFVGYPNTGKSSIINTLRKKMVCKTAPIPGETKIWQYITLTRRIYLIDCPGIVPPNPNDTDAQLLLRGVVRVENIKEPSQYVAIMLERCQTRHIERTYGIKGWKDDDDFLEILARKGGRLLRGGEADSDAVARMVLSDFLRGKVPWYVPPPKAEGEEQEGIEGRKGRLGEMTTGSKRKREDKDDAGADDADSVGSSDISDSDNDFEGFGGEHEDAQESDDDDNEDDDNNETAPSLTDGVSEAVTDAASRKDDSNESDAENHDSIPAK